MALLRHHWMDQTVLVGVLMLGRLFLLTNLCSPGYDSEVGGSCGVEFNVAASSSYLAMIRALSSWRLLNKFIFSFRISFKKEAMISLCWDLYKNVVT